MKFLLYILTFTWGFEISGSGINNTSFVIPDNPSFLKEYFNPFSRFMLKVDQNPFQNILNSGKDINTSHCSVIHHPYKTLLSGELFQIPPHLFSVCACFFARAP